MILSRDWYNYHTFIIVFYGAKARYVPSDCFNYKRKVSAPPRRTKLTKNENLILLYTRNIVFGKCRKERWGGGVTPSTPEYRILINIMSLDFPWRDRGGGGKKKTLSKGTERYFFSPVGKSSVWLWREITVRKILNRPRLILIHNDDDDVG